MRKSTLLAVTAGLILASASQAINYGPTNMPPGPAAGPCNEQSPPWCGDRPTFITSSFDVSGATTQRWVFASNHSDHILVNRQNPATGQWEFAVSPIAVQVSNPDPTTTIALGSVFRQGDDPASYYREPGSEATYRWIMYFVFQALEQVTPASAGSVCVAYSHDGLNWTEPVWAVYANSGTRGRRCGVGPGGEVKAEAISGFHSSNSAIQLFHLEGDLNLLDIYVGSTNTLIYYSTTTVTNPDVLTKVGTVSSGGISTFNWSGGTDHRYFVNSDFTYDAVSGYLWATRVYPFPFRADPNYALPCTGSCPRGLGTLPMRAQLLKMYVGGNFAKVLTDPWIEVEDFGDFYGHQKVTFGLCQPYPLVLPGVCVPFESFLPDVDSLSFHKTPLGRAHINNQSQFLFFTSLWANVPREASCQNHSSPSATFQDAALYRFRYPPLATEMGPDPCR